MHHGGDGVEMKEGRYDSRQTDLQVWNSQPFRHDKGGRPHDRGHDLPAGGSRGLYRPGKFRPVADALHHGMVKEPMVTQLAMALPLIIPKKPLAIIDTLAGPPGVPPATAMARSIKNFPSPVWEMNRPKSTK